MCVQGQKVTAWHAGYGQEREFPIYMAGFAVNLELIMKYSGAEFTQIRSGCTVKKWVATVARRCVSIMYTVMIQP